MSSTPACPSAERLRQHLAGALPGSEEAEVVAHLDACPACQRALEGLAAGDSVRAAARLEGEAAPPGPALRPVLQGLGARDSAGPTAAEDLPLDFLRPPEQPGHLGRLGHYEVLELVGRGGMGVVFRAHDERLQRVVAIKVLAPHLAGSTLARERFLREARAAAAVSHDHVVTTHAVEEDGVPYLVMQYVSGVSLHDRMRRRGPLGVKEVLRIGTQAARGLAAAHAQGLVHRDVKPANILLENGVERVKITDFGLARAAEDVSLTQEGAVAGTPAYMSPEQANAERVDARSDLFSLGTVLYEMCTGALPFRGGSAAVLRSVANDVPRPLRQLNPEVPEALAAVIEKLHAKDPARRYQSAAELAEVLGGLLAEAQQASGAVRARPPARCRRVLTALAAAVLLGLGVLAVMKFWPRPEPGPADDSSQPGRDASLVRAPDRDKPSAQPSKDTGASGKRPGSKPTWTPPPGPAGEVRTFRGHTDILRAVAVSADGRFAVSGGHDGTTRVWDLADGRQVRRGPEHPGPVRAVALAPDGKTVLSGGRGGPEVGRPASPDDYVLRLWDRTSGKELGQLRGHDKEVCSVGFSRDGARAVSGSGDGTVRLWDVKNRELIHCFRGHTDSVYSVALSGDGNHVLSASADRTVRLWDTRTGSPVPTFEGRGHRSWVYSVAFSPDGKHALSASMDGTARLWDLADGREVRRYDHPTGVASVAFSPDGSRFLSASGFASRGNDFFSAHYDEVLRLWDVKSGRELLRLEGHRNSPSCVAFLPDGGHALSGGMDRTLRLWRLHGRPPKPRPPDPRVIRFGPASPNEFFIWRDGLEPTGYTPFWVQVHEIGFSQRVVAIAVRSTRTSNWLNVPHLDRSEVQQRLAAWGAKGFRLLSLTGYTEKGEEKYSACLARGAVPPLQVTLALAPADYPKELERLRGRKRRPFGLSAAPTGDGALLAVLHGPDDGKTSWESWADLTEAQYAAKLKVGKARGCRPLSVVAYPTADGLRYALLVVKDGVTDWAEAHGLTEDGLKDWAAAQDKKGYRPLVIVGYPVEGESRYLGVWVKDELAKPLGPPQKK
jgi:WD40 repeat protein